MPEGFGLVVAHSNAKHLLVYEGIDSDLGMPPGCRTPSPRRKGPGGPVGAASASKLSYLRLGVARVRCLPTWLVNSRLR